VTAARTGRARAAVTTARAVVARPRLWPEAVATARRLAPQRWWRRFPFLPLPDPAYWRFRMSTAFGDDWSGRPSTADVVAYLEWCQRVHPGHR
jgi:hypothetical protein